MSDFLKRCRVLANYQPDAGKLDDSNPPKEDSEPINKTIHTSAGYIKLLDYAERLEIELNKTNDKIEKMLNLVEQYIAEHGE